MIQMDRQRTDNVNSYCFIADYFVTLPIINSLPLKQFETNIHNSFSYERVSIQIQSRRSRRQMV